MDVCVRVSVCMLLDRYLNQRHFYLQHLLTGVKLSEEIFSQNCVYISSC